MHTVTAAGRWMRACTLVLCIILLLGILPNKVAAEESVRSTPPDTGSCVLYRYADECLAPTLYIWGLRTDALFRVYGSQSLEDAPIGQGRYQQQGGYCAIALRAEDLESVTGGYVYLSRQVDGEQESERVAVRCNAAATPSVNLSVWRVRANEQPVETDGTVKRYYEPVSQSVRGKSTAPGSLVAGQYYRVDISLRDFQTLQSLSLPIKYDPEVFELASLTYDKRATSATSSSTTAGYYLGGAAVATGADGVNCARFISAIGDGAYEVGGYAPYGLGVYAALQSKWGAQQDASTGSEQQTPYVNTETGLIKLEFYSNAPVDLSGMNDPVVRIYFKCLKTPTETVNNWTNAACLHFASQADLPDTLSAQDRNDPRVQRRYYNTVHPNGWEAYVDSINIMTPPLYLTGDTETDTVATYTTRVGLLSAEEIYALPQSLSTADQICSLLQNSVTIHNYTNSGTYAQTTLDGKYGTQDVLILSSGAAEVGDQISVYLKNSDGSYSSTPIAGPKTVNAECGVVLALGTDNLLPEGGIVGVTVTRSGIGESQKVEIRYAAETDRDVYFRLSTTNKSSVVSEGQAFDDTLRVVQGDQLRLDIWFNDFDDLLAYTFEMGFDHTILEATDSSYRSLEDTGYISEENFRLGNSCLAVGESLTDLTFNEELAYELWTEFNDKGSLSQAEVEQSMAALGIGSLTELKALAESVAAKHAMYGAAGNALSWKGGLLFTGDVRAPGTNGESDPGRDENSLYPYVNNQTGKIRIMSAALVDPPLQLHGSGEGYHILTLYFKAKATGYPKLTLCGTENFGRVNGVQRAESGSGTEVVLTGPGATLTESSTETVCAVAFTSHWNLYSMEKTVQKPSIQLLAGNATDADCEADSQNKTALYLYDGYAFRDPGFILKAASGATLIDTQTGSINAAVQLRRYFVNGSQTVELPAWQSGEALAAEDYFHVRTDADGTRKYSDTYTLVYEYTDGDGNTVTASRLVYVIFQRGDLNGDGQVDLFDEQMYCFEQTNDILDELYLSKTLLDQKTLHEWLLGAERGGLEYIMPVARSPDVYGTGSSATDAFRVWLEFYPVGTDPGAQDSTALDPGKLPAGQTVTAVLRYENLHALFAQPLQDGDGLMNLAVALQYDPAHLRAVDFAEDAASGLLLWTQSGQSLNSDLATVNADAALQSAASDTETAVQGETAAQRRIYVQYLSESGDPVFCADNGILAAVRMQVSADAFQDSPVAWADYALTTWQTDTEVQTELNRGALLDGTVKFQKPADVAVSNTAAGGYSITGLVTSYNAALDISYQLYRRMEDGTYEAAALLAGNVQITPDGSGATAGSHTEAFEIKNVPSGVYKLVLFKRTHLKFTISNIQVATADVALDTFNAVGTIYLVAGDLNEDGRVNSLDTNKVFSPEVINKSTSEVSAELALADADGNGRINSIDTNVVFNSKHINRSSTDAAMNIALQ